MTKCNRDVVERWMKECGAAADAHYDAARYAERMHLFFGLSSAVLAALVGCGIVLTFNRSPEFWERAAAVLITVCSVVLSAVQTFANFSLRAADHKSAASGFDALRRRCEEMLALGVSQVTPLEPLRLDIDAASDAAVSLPERFKNPILVARGD